MSLENRKREIVHWHNKNKGFVKDGNLAPHALRLLNEAVELCLACGAVPSEIRNTSNEEIHKQLAKKGLATLKDIGDEIADVQLLLFVLSSYSNVNLNEECVKKIKILEERKWKVDADGVLWRDKTK